MSLISFRSSFSSNQKSQVAILSKTPSKSSLSQALNFKSFKRFTYEALNQKDKKSNNEKKSSKKVVTKSSSKSKSKDKKDKSPKSTTKSQKSQKSKKSSKSKTITKSNIDENKSEINKDELSKNLLPFIPNQIQPTQNIPMNTFDKCEGCFQGDGYCFCTNCGKIYCKICDDQLHVVPA